MKRIWSLVVIGLVVSLIFPMPGNIVHAAAAESPDEIVPASIPTEPMPPDLTPTPLFAPLFGSTPPAVCVAVDTGGVTLSPFGGRTVEVAVFTENATQVEVAGTFVPVDAEGVARVEVDAQPGETYAVQVNGRAVENCDFRFDETPSQFVGVHGDPYAWVGGTQWLDQGGLLNLFTAETTELVVDPALLTERTERNGRWTYVLHYAGPGMELYSGLLRPGNDVFQHFFRSVLITPEGRMLRIYNLGHTHRPETLGHLTIDTGPGSSPVLWNENGRVELEDFTVEFRISATHNGIHQAALVTVPGDNSQWVFTRELNGGGAFISERVDGRIITDDLDTIGGAFGRLLRGEDPTLDEWVVGVVDGDMPGPYIPPAEDVPPAEGTDTPESAQLNPDTDTLPDDAPAAAPPAEGDEALVEANP